MVNYDFLGNIQDTSWYKKLKETCEELGEDVEQLVTTLSDEELHQDFSERGYCGDDFFVLESEFIAWSENYVFLPNVYYVSARVDPTQPIVIEIKRVPRNPSEHVR